MERDGEERLEGRRRSLEKMKLFVICSYPSLSLAQSMKGYRFVVHSLFFVHSFPASPPPPDSKRHLIGSLLRVPQLVPSTQSSGWHTVDVQ